MFYFRPEIPTPDSPVASCSGTTSMPSPKKGQNESTEDVHMEVENASPEYEYVDIEKAQSDQVSLKSAKGTNV